MVILKFDAKLPDYMLLSFRWINENVSGEHSPSYVFISIVGIYQIILATNNSANSTAVCLVYTMYIFVILFLFCIREALQWN